MRRTYKMLGHENVRQAEAEGDWEGKSFIVTYTGKVFPFDDITPDCIDIQDIAHSLSHLCRWTGHTNMFYSVAQHSLLVSERMPGKAAEKLVGLLHDGAEAYTNDLASPLKKWMQSSDGGVIHDSVYGCLQDSITAMIYNKYGVTRIPENVRLYDSAAGLFEAEGLMGLEPSLLEKYGFPVHLRGLWQPWEPNFYAETSVDQEFGDIETRFLKRFEDLMEQLGRSTEE
jgi:hypothetical protein